MNTSYFNTASFANFLSKKTKLILIVFFIFIQTAVLGQSVGDYRSTGNVTFAAATNWQIYNGSAWVSTTIAPKDSPYTSANTITLQSGHTATISIAATIAAQLTVQGIFILDSGASLSIGPMYVDSSGNAVGVSAGSALTVNGNFTVKKGDMDVAGTVYIDGNFSTETGNVDVIGGGSMASSGTMTTQGDSTIFGSKNNCTSGPCSGTSLNCQSVISPPSQTICANSQSAPITFTLSGATVVKWQSTTDFINFTDIANTTTTLPAQTVTQTTRFMVVYTTSVCSLAVNSPFATVTVNPAPTTAAAGVDQSKCNTATFTLAGNNPTVGTGAWTLVSGTATITTPTSNTSGVIGVTAGTSATLRWTITNGSCASTDDVVLTNNTVPSAPTGSSSQSFCSGASVANLSATGTAIKWYATASGGTALVTTTALVNGTHYYASQTIGCESTSRLDVTAIVNTTNTWTGTTNGSWFNESNWSCGFVPTITSDVIIPDKLNKPVIDGVNTTALANTITVDSGSSLTINIGNTLKVTDKLTNNNGTITFLDDASLVQTNNVKNSGNIDYERITNSVVRSTDYTYWSSPVSPQKIGDFSPDTPDGMMYSYDSSIDDWNQEYLTSAMIAGKGYIVRGPEPSGIPATPAQFTANFVGEPNNGTIPVSVYSGKSCLLGNPYPSAIDADTFITANTASIDGTLYFWTHNTPIAIGTPDPGTGVYAYSGNDYATYTLSGGVATKTGNFTPEWVDKDLDRIVDLPGEYFEKNGVSGMQTAEWTDSGIIGTLETGEWTDTNKNNIAETGEWIDIDKDGILDLPAEWTDTNGNSLKDFGEWTDTNGNGVFNIGEWTDTNGDKILNLEVEQVSNKPTGKIAAGQGFFTTSTAAGGTVNFTNAMRVDGSGNSFDNSNFYKTKNPKAKTNTAVEKNRVWLNLTNKQGAFKQTLVGYITGASNTWDNLYDGESFDGNDFLDFYSINDEKNLTIQGRALPFDENDEVPLGYRIAVEGTFTIKIDETDGVLANQTVFIEDKLTNTTVDLKTGNYTFNTVAGTFNDRFVLRYKDNSTAKTLGTETVDTIENKVLVSNKNKQIKINSNSETIDKVMVYDVSGKLIYKKEKASSQEVIISNLTAKNQLLIVKTTLQNGKTETNKVIF